MATQPGRTLSHYRLVEKIGEGGMGVVWKAVDTNLDREVAIKTLAEEFIESPERLARLEREAKLLASLSHPAIASVYGLHEADGVRFLSMELVEGEDLAKRLKRGAVPADEALAIAHQIAEALEAAHERGVVHRDLKPANVMVTGEDQVKVLDFGLAKVAATESQTADPSRSPTLTSGGTLAGVILGTAAYMSPEQARGKAVDKKTDVWAFGCVLYEMLSGKKAFEGETVTDVLARVLQSEPDWDALPEGTPWRIRELLRKCLRKERRDRLHDIADARIEIGDAREEPSTGSFAGTMPVESRRAGARITMWLGLVAALLIGALAGFWGASSRGPQTPEWRTGVATRTEIELPVEAALALGTRAALVGWQSPVIAISPDGSHLVYVGLSGETTQLYLRRLNGFEITPIPGTEGAIHPFFSPDGRWIGYLTNRKVKKIPLEGGASLTLCDATSPMTASWTRDDQIYFNELEGARLTRVGAAGGDPVEVVPYMVGRRVGEVLAGGDAVLLSAKTGGTGRDFGEVQVLSLETQETKSLIRNGYDPRYLATGHLLFFRAGGVFAVPFDPERLEVTGKPRSVLSGIRMDSFSGMAQLDVSESGLLVYVPGGDTSIGKPAWVDRDGDTEFFPVDERVYGTLDLAPDGKRLAVHVADVSDYVWLYDMARGEGKKLRPSENDGWPIWSWSGDAIAFTSGRWGGEWRVLLKSLGGRAAVRQLLQDEVFPYPGSWSPDDDVIAVSHPGGIRFLSTAGEPEIAWDTGVMPEFSPDGRWVAYSSDHGGQYEIFVRSYPDGETVHQISTDWGGEARWCRECSELFYRRGNQWMASRVRFEPELTWDKPRLVFETDFIDTPGRSYDVSPDGQRLLVIKRVREPETTKLRVITNFHQQLDPID